MNKILLLSMFSTIVMFAKEPEIIGQGKPERNVIIENAIKECSSTSGVDSYGNPDMKKMDLCMSSKGFSKPNKNGKENDKSGFNDKNF